MTRRQRTSVRGSQPVFMAMILGGFSISVTYPAFQVFQHSYYSSSTRKILSENDERIYVNMRFLLKPRCFIIDDKYTDVSVSSFHFAEELSVTLLFTKLTADR